TMWNSPERFHFLPEYVDELAEMAFDRPADPSRYYLLAAKGDEVLDWREMVDWYHGCELRLLEESDHGISDFEQWLPEVLERILPSRYNPAVPIDISAASGILHTHHVRSL